MAGPASADVAVKTLGLKHETGTSFKPPSMHSYPKGFSWLLKIIIKAMTVANTLEEVGGLIRDKRRYYRDQIHLHLWSDTGARPF